MKIDNTFFLIGRIKEHYTEFLEDELTREGMKSLVTSHADIIAVLGIYGEMTLSEVAEKINRDPSTVTALVAKLRNLKYVQQRRSDADKRSSLLSLTERGKGLVPEFRAIGALLMKKASAGIAEEEWSDFRKTLEKVYRNFL